MRTEPNDVYEPNDTQEKAQLRHGEGAMSGNIISRLPGCAGRAADAVSAYTQVIMEDAPKLLKIPKSECPDIWIRLPRHKCPKSRSSMEDPVFPLERNLYGHPFAGLLWERQFEEVFFRTRLWKKFQIGNTYVSCRVCGQQKTDSEESKHWPNMESTWERSRFGRANIIFRSLLITLYSTRMRNEDIVEDYRNMFQSRISAGFKEQLPCWKLDSDISSWSYNMEGHAKKCMERYCELGNKTTQQLYKVINSRPWWPSFQRRRIGICWRIVKSMLSNCPEMPVFGTHW